MHLIEWWYRAAGRPDGRGAGDRAVVSDPRYRVSMDLDYDRITKIEDRSFTFALLDHLDDPRAADALLTLDDPRAREPLLRIVEDRGRTASEREAAASVLAGSLDGVRRDDALRWWASGDELLRRRALFAMGVEDSDIVAPIASSRRHRFHRVAIATMAFGFEAPRFQALKIAALNHPDPAVRVAAAEVLLWDEPLAAEDALLRHADDPDPAVACAVIRTLEYYPTRRVQNRLETLPGRHEIADALRNTLESLRIVMSPMQREEPGDAPPATPTPPAPKIRLPIEAILAEHNDPEGPWAKRKARLREIDWTAFDADERTRLMTHFTTHPDPGLREGAWRPLSAWDDAFGLLPLLHDPVPGVVKSTAYGLGLTSPDPRVAAALRAHLDDPSVASTHAEETVTAWVAHAGRAAILDLLGFVRDERESFRRSAVRALVKLDARDAVATLLPLLEAPPLVTWAVHVALLEACRKLGLPPLGLDALRAVDNPLLADAVAAASVAS